MKGMGKGSQRVDKGTVCDQIAVKQWHQLVHVF